MPLYTPEEPGFLPIAEQFRWFENVLAVEYGELDTEDTVPETLNWVQLLPPDMQLGLEDVDCSLAYTDEQGYHCTIWDVSGEDDFPWAVFVVDTLGPRLLTEYSLLVEEGDEAELEAVLARTAEELPQRLLDGEFVRRGEPTPIPDYLLVSLDEEG